MPVSVPTCCPARPSSVSITSGPSAFIDGLLPALALGEAPAAVVISSNGATLTPKNEALVDLLLTDDEEASCAMAETLDGATVYGMSKLAMTIGLRRRTAVWAAEGVRLNAVAPGPVETPLLKASLEDKTLGPLIESLPVPMGRRAAAHEIAGAVGFLLDPVNSFVHGSLLFVDGGVRRPHPPRPRLTAGAGPPGYQRYWPSSPRTTRLRLRADCRRLSSNRLILDPWVGLVGSRGVSVLRPSAKRAARRRRATSRLRDCERSSPAETRTEGPSRSRSRAR